MKRAARPFRRFPSAFLVLLSLIASIPGTARALEGPAGDAGTPGVAQRVDEARALVDLLRRTEARYRGIGPFRLDFEQSFDSPSFGVEETDRGAIHVDPPLRMLWEYIEPAGQRAVMVGPTWWLIEPDLRQVIRRDRPPGSSDPVIDLLAGTLDLLNVFAARPSVEPPEVPGRVVVELVPREPRDDVEIAVAEIEPGTADLRRLVIIDPLGSRLVIRLGRPERTEEPAAERFRVELPDGWTLIRD